VSVLVLSGCPDTTHTGIPVGPAWVTLACVGLYYLFMVHVLRTKVRVAREYEQRGEAFDRYHSGDREMLAADRIQLNMLEHMPAFLILLWLHALIVDIDEATIVGGIYVAFRAVYPVVLGKRLGRRVPKRLLFVTFGGYAVLVFLAIRIGMKLLAGA
jgi:uncharacterized membrane protein YecN with MAPEG domain